MVQQVDYATQLPQYDMMICSVLKAGHVFRTSPDCDDYYQELRLIILLQLMGGYVPSPCKNNSLYRLLLWRLRDFQRQAKRYDDHTCFEPADENIEDLRSSNALDRFELHQVLAKLVTREKNKSDLERVIIDLIKYPTDTISNRCARLGIHRATYARWLKQIRLLMLDVTA